MLKFELVEYRTFYVYDDKDCLVGRIYGVTPPLYGGHYYFFTGWPASGMLSAAVLREIADWIDAKNAAWDAEVAKLDAEVVELYAKVWEAEG